MTPQELMQLVLDATNTNDYDDVADGWLSTSLPAGDRIFKITFKHADGRESVAVWTLIGG